ALQASFKGLRASGFDSDWHALAGLRDPHALFSIRQKLITGSKCERFHTKHQGLEALKYHEEKLGKTYPSLAQLFCKLFSSKENSNEKLALYVQIGANGDERKEFRTTFTVNPQDNEDILEMEFAKQQISFLFHCAGLLAYGRSMRCFPKRESSSPINQEPDRENNSRHPCPACGKEIAKSARTCPHCGENMRGLQKPNGWRQKSCSNCGAVMSRFAEKCQQHDCGHPNTWLKMQSFVATLAVLGTGLWSFLHFQQHLMAGIALPLMATALAIGWRGILSLLKSFYGH
ncbi:MAG: zinc-ribbon domain-containing protein, partial [Verrucomicrobia bacterium]|nr:zinc-ribbon domain-containing protein [Verrucomicrobiota bacterium]